ncbi:mitochondrial phospholipid-translocating ATPase [Andalucia godoyi]|uniref:Phospholipid-transporting ATPase n=1 Tax=Andalucia godoyi TaxID=505711 RepID=A0A8K0AIH2_ANDGO|nr:mitochondrial phospholipid-translocating ATPase [Andalucia godoyi]|eukprot:ANDGO_01919.mRNA.1 mitochondrial phospholipid-translocating ATPase
MVLPSYPQSSNRYRSLSGGSSNSAHHHSDFHRRQAIMRRNPFHPNLLASPSPLVTSGSSESESSERRLGAEYDRLFAPEDDDDRNENEQESTPFIPGDREQDQEHAKRLKRGFWTTAVRIIHRTKRRLFGEKADFKSRTMNLRGETTPIRSSFVPNVVRNQKYSVLTFIPQVLYEQFRFFFNMYFLIVALSQFIPALKVGFLFTYIAPLIFVLIVTMIKEAYDDFQRYVRDKEANSQKYDVLTEHGVVQIPSSKIRVGDLVIVHTNQRVPADGILLRTTEKGGASFVRTDQLDGETDWKLRRALSSCQALSSDRALLSMEARVYAEAPRKEIYEFVGTFQRGDDEQEPEPVSLENTMWSNCVVASGTCVLLIVYTGRETRAVMNTTHPRAKVGALDAELNFLSKLLFLFMLLMSVLMVSLRGYHGSWYVYLFRFILLFSSIIPISLRVNLDMGKTMYSWFMMRDGKIAGTVVRNSAIPEELGRVSYLLSDKTGTLTQNDMIFKKLHLGLISFSRDSLMNAKEYLRASYSMQPQSSGASSGAYSLDYDADVCRGVRDAIQALSLCHNVTPVLEDGARQYQASSPDEVALVKFAEVVGLVLENRTQASITLRNPNGSFEEYEILQVFPFTSERKRAGIIVKSLITGETTFYLKGADTVMLRILYHSDWLSEECDNMAREGLRTLVIAKRVMADEEYAAWLVRYKEAQTKILNRTTAVQAVVDSLEVDMRLLALTGVEDRLQQGVPQALEMLRNAGVRVWMLTGDKVDTAICVARASKLVNRSQAIRIIQGTQAVGEIRSQLADCSSLRDLFLVVDGTVLEVCLKECRNDFFRTASEASSVAVCRCSPTQKAQVVRMLKAYVPSKRTCAIGDGGNDVSMITAADVGIGIVGKEGKQASLAADFSIMQFSFITRLLLWHGRNAYKRSARLSQFVIHRGLIISIIQAAFSAIVYFAAIPIYTGWLMVGYATYYTMFPVFSLVLDSDVDEEIALTYPELYKELQKGRSLSYKTFLIWVMKAVYQGAAIMILAILFFEDSLLRIVSITFTSLIVTELLMVLFEVHHVTRWMTVSEIVSAVIYLFSILLLPTYFDTLFMFTFAFWWRVLVIVMFSVLPVYVAKIIHRRFSPPVYAKLNNVV